MKKSSKTIWWIVAICGIPVLVVVLFDLAPHLFLPDHATAKVIDEHYGVDIEMIRNALNAGIRTDFGDGGVPVSDDVLAVFTLRDGDDVDVYARYEAELEGEAIADGAGIAKVRLDGQLQTCLVYEVVVDEEKTYRILLRDRLESKR